MSYLRRTTRLAARSLHFHQAPRQAIHPRLLSTKLDASTISKITEAEQKLTGQVDPVPGGPTAAAQSHSGEQLNASNISSITAGEKTITGADGPVKGGPTSAAQSILTNSGVGPSDAARANSTQNQNQNQTQTQTGFGRGETKTRSGNGNGSQSLGVLDSETISKITDAEKKITGSDQPVRGGPTAAAQKHANEAITSEALSDITRGEKKVAGERVKGGSTSKAQSELGKSRN